MSNLLQNLFKFFPPLLLPLPNNLRSLNPFSRNVNPVTNDSNFTVTHQNTLGNIRYVKRLFSANTVFKTTLNTGLRREPIKSLATGKMRLFRPTAQVSSFFNPSETRRLLTWLQSVFGARDQPGSLKASRRTTDGTPLHIEHNSGTDNSILLSGSDECSLSRDEYRTRPKSFTPCSGEWPSTNYRNYYSVSRQRKRYFPHPDSDDALELEQLLQRRLVRNGFISDRHDASGYLCLVHFAKRNDVLRSRYCIE